MQKNNPARVSNLIGFASSLTLGLMFLLYVGCFVGIMGSGPLFVWSGIEPYLAYIKSHDQTLKLASYTGMLLFCFAFALLAEVVCAAAPESRRVPARAGATLAWLFALASGGNYFVQLTVARWGAEAGGVVLEQIVMANPHSLLSAVNMLGWTVLLGSSCLLLAVSLEGCENRAARVSLLACAANSLVAALGFLLDNAAVLAVTMYPLLGGTMLVVSAVFSLRFRKALLER